MYCEDCWRFPYYYLGCPTDIDQGIFSSTWQPNAHLSYKAKHQTHQKNWLASIFFFEMVQNHRYIAKLDFEASGFAEESSHDVGEARNPTNKNNG